MNILQPKNTSVNVGPSPELQAKMQANQLKNTPRRILDQLFNQWSSAFDLLWQEKNGVTAEMRLGALGESAGELMASSSVLCQFLLQLVEGVDDNMKNAILGRLATLPDIEIHPDGTVTVVL
jgi:hypothetical protein